MEQLLTLILHWSYLGIFLVIFAESGFLLGFFLPGDSLLFSVGLLASQGVFNIWILIPLCIVAAILGDNFGYYWGKKMGPKVFAREDSVLFHRKHVESTKAFYEKHGSKTIVLARFVPIIRTFAPIFAGVGSMPYQTFFFFNVVGGLLWGGGLTLLGFFLGGLFPGLEHYLSFVIVAIIALSIFPVAREFLSGKHFQKNLLWIAIITFLFFDALVAFLKFPFLLRLNEYLHTYFLGNAPSSLFPFMRGISEVLSPEVLSGLFVLLVLVFLLKKKYQDFFLVLITGFGAVASSVLLKILFGVARPETSLVEESALSFPSGHALMSTVFFGLIFLLLREKYSGWKKFVLGLVCIGSPLLISFTRLYLGVHWFTDVVGGIAFGLFGLCVSYLVVSNFSKVAETFFPKK